MGKKEKQIILITGPKHSGKTFAGRALAGIGNGVFIDLDELVESLSRETPRALYKKGPEVFRKAEAGALSHALNVSVESFGAAGFLVIAAGGGLIDNGAAIDILKTEKGSRVITVYLEVRPETAWKRILEAGELPPFLQTNNPEETHRELHERRAASYRAFAQITINAENKNPDEIAREIREIIKPQEIKHPGGPAFNQRRTDRCG